MKHIIILAFFLCIISIAKAQRSQETFTITIKTSSEIRAKNFADKLSAQTEITAEQKESIQELIRNFLEESQEMIGREEMVPMLQRLEEKTDNKALKILKTEAAFNEYKKCMAELKTQQGKGYGRR